MALRYECDVCKNLLDDFPPSILTLRFGGQIIDIKVGVHQTQAGHTCPECIKKTLALIAKKGIFVGGKITMPEDIQPFIPAIEVKDSHYLLRK
jgi:hypothetical protein